MLYIFHHKNIMHVNCTFNGSNLPLGRVRMDDSQLWKIAVGPCPLPWPEKNSTMAKNR